MKLIQIISEEIQKHIDETYQSVSEIRELSEDIIKILSNNIYNELKKNGKITKFGWVHLQDINYTQYNEIKEFIKNVNLTIYFSNRLEKTGGDYRTIVGNWKYNNYYDFTINIYIKELPAEIWLINTKYQENNDITERDIYLMIYKNINNVLIHELQHAYDDFRSKNKIFQNKRHSKFFSTADNIESKTQNQHNKEEIDFKEKAKQELRYLRLDSEIWARFIQAIDKTYFTTIDDDVNDKFVFIMRPLKKVISDFKHNYGNYNQLTDKQKKRIIKAVSQFWHYEKEKLESENK